MVAKEGSSVIYVQMTGKLYKCAPEQLRPLTAPETYLTTELNEQIHLLDPKVRKGLLELEKGIDIRADAPNGDPADNDIPTEPVPTEPPAVPTEFNPIPTQFVGDSFRAKRRAEEMESIPEVRNPIVIPGNVSEPSVPVVPVPVDVGVPVPDTVTATPNPDGPPTQAGVNPPTTSPASAGAEATAVPERERSRSPRETCLVANLTTPVSPHLATPARKDPATPAGPHCISFDKVVNKVKTKRAYKTEAVEISIELDEAYIAELAYEGITGEMPARRYIEKVIEHSHKTKNAVKSSTIPARKKRVEITERNLTNAEKDQFRTAKASEWQSWISNEVVKIMDSRHIPKDRIIRARWV